MKFIQKIRQFALQNAEIINRINKATKTTTLAVAIIVIPLTIAKPQPYQTAIKFDPSSVNPLVSESNKIAVVSVPSRGEIADSLRGLDPEGIKALMQEIAPEYGIDWKFVYAIGWIESNYSSSLARRNYNFFGRKASSHSWRKYPDPETAVRDQFAYLKEHYYDRGLDTPREIGPIYCEGNTWAGKVSTVMAKL